MKAIVVPKEYLNLVWYKVEPLLRMATEHSNDRYNTDIILKDLHADLKLLWILLDEEDEIQVALTTSVEDYPGRRAIRVSFAGGKNFLDHTDVMEEVITDFGRSIGCTQFEVLGRWGWKKVLEPKGFKLSYICMDKEI